MHSVSRFVLGLSLITLGTLTMAPGDAWAKKDSTAKAVTYTEIKETGISQFDEVFNKAKAIHDTMATQETNLATARTSANTALGVATDAPLSTGLAALVNAAGGKVSVAMNGTTPHLNAASGADATVTKGVDGVNGLIDAGAASVLVANALLTQATELATACADFPTQIKTLGLDAATLLKATPITASNIKSVGQTTGRISALGTAVAAIFTDVTTAFK